MLGMNTIGEYIKKVKNRIDASRIYDALRFGITLCQRVGIIR